MEPLRKDLVLARFLTCGEIVLINMLLWFTLEDAFAVEQHPKVPQKISSAEGKIGQSFLADHPLQKSPCTWSLGWMWEVSTRLPHLQKLHLDSHAWQSQSTTWGVEMRRPGPPWNASGNSEWISLCCGFSTCKNGMLWPLKSRNISSKCVEQLSELWKTSRFTFAARYFTASFQNGKLLRRNIFSLEFKTNIVWTSEGQIKKVCRDVCSSSSMLGKTFLVADLDVDMLW